MSDEATSGARHTGHVHDVGMLDLRYAHSPEDLANINHISDVGVILIPEFLVGALASIEIHDVGGIVPIPQDGKVTILTGQARLTGETLSNGDPDTILIVAGQAFITGQVTSVGYKEMRIFGQLFAPRSGQSAISSKLSQMSGQSLYYSGEPRVIMGQQSIGQEYLELLPEPVTLVIMGHARFKNDVARDLLQSKVLEIVLMGRIEAPEALIPMIEVLAKERMGDISASQ